jgi:ribose transport system ATP-binding protein
MSPLVQLDGVSKGYGGVQALDDVSLAIEAGAVHALVGENGAGKSTLVKILTGVVQPDDGRLLVEGEPQRIRRTRTGSGSWRCTRSPRSSPI